MSIAHLSSVYWRQKDYILLLNSWLCSRSYFISNSFQYVTRKSSVLFFMRSLLYGICIHTNSKVINFGISLVFFCLFFWQFIAIKLVDLWTVYIFLYSFFLWNKSYRIMSPKFPARMLQWYNYEIEEKNFTALAEGNIFESCVALT